MRKQGRRWLVTSVAVAALTGFPAVDAAGLPVEVQQVDVPKLLPDAELPQLPGGGDSVSVPELPGLPQLPGGGGGGGGGGLPSVPDAGSLLGDGSGGSGTGDGGGGATVPGAAPPGGGSSSAPSSQTQASGSRSTASSASSGGGRSSARSQRRQEQRAEEREFRETVAELAGCVSTLSARERPVVVMRAGLYGMPAVSRARVAERLGISVRRVRALERRAVASLRTAARSEGCGRNAPPASADVSGVPPLISNASMETVPALVSPAEMGSGGADDAPQVRGASTASSDVSSGGSPAAAGLNPVEESGGLPLVLGLLMMLLLFGIFLALGVALQRRRLFAAAPQGAGAAPVAAQPLPSAEPVERVPPAEPVEPVERVPPAEPVEPVVTRPAPVPPRPDALPLGGPRPSAADAHGAARANGRARRVGAPAAIVASGIASLLLSRLFKGGFASRVLGRARRR